MRAVAEQWRNAEKAAEALLDQACGLVQSALAAWFPTPDEKPSTSQPIVVETIPGERELWAMVMRHRGRVMRAAGTIREGLMPLGGGDEPDDLAGIEAALEELDACGPMLVASLHSLRAMIADQEQRSAAA